MNKERSVHVFSNILMANPTVSHRKRRAPTRWSDLPGELLYTIFANLTNPLDVYRCGIVCVSWKSVIKTILPHFILHNSNIYDRFGYDNKFMFFNILTKKIHKMPVSKFLGTFSTSNFGRLLTVAYLKIRDTYRIRLLNPFSGQEIKLLSLKDREDSTEKLRAVTSTSPSDPNCLVLAFAVNLFFCRPGDENWIKIQGSWNACSDIIFYKGNFYVVNFDNDLFCIHCNGPVTSEKLPLQPIEFQRILIKSRHCSYLVELDGNLLLVVRYVSSEIFGYPRTFRFQVYELNWQEKNWIEVKSIGDSVILLGRMNSISLHVGEFTSLKANCIYFISDDDVTIQDEDKDKIIDHDNGIYNMATEHFEYFYGSAPIWIYPLTWFRLKL